MKYLLYCLFLLLSSRASLEAQENFILTGQVSDSLTQESLIGATVYIRSLSKGTQTDTEGNFRMELKRGNYVVLVTYVGYRSRQVNLAFTGNRHLQVLLSPEAVNAGEVIVTAKNASQNTESTRTGMVEVTGKAIRKLPALMGEADLIRALQYAPGIQNAGDGNSGYNVRGGNVDQNLILLDNAMVFNPSHVLGFFSVFNPDAVGQATLIKSGMPAEYGGRISSVLVVKTVDGNFEKLAGSIHAGLIDSKVTLQGPLIENRLSFFVSLRKTYINQIVMPVLSLFTKQDSNGVFSGNRFDLYDFNAKLTWKPGSGNRISLMCYKGRDNFSMNRSHIGYSNRISWGNTILALNWNHWFNDSAYMMHSLNFSQYDFRYASTQYILDMRLYSAISSFNYRFEYTQADFLHGDLKTGIDLRFYRFVPDQFMLSLNQSDLNYGTFQDLYATELSGFASWEKDLGKKVRFYAGLRVTNYNHYGPYTYTGKTTDPSNADTIRYNPGEIVQSYTYPEPRLAVRIQTGGQSSVKASLTRNYQFIHVASSTSVTLPSDIWIPSTRQVKPQYGDQITLGYYRNFRDKTFSASAEAYFKNLKNQVELLYGLGTSIQESSVENNLSTGRGYSTGIELYFQKVKGKLTGSLAYSLSRSVRQFDQINDGYWFPAKYDHRHQINLAAGYAVNQRLDLSLAFVFASGNAMTLPIQKYFIEGNLINEYGKTNGFRMPPYHRLDLSVNWHFKPKYLKSSVLNFSVFNVYNRANPFLIYFDVHGDIQHYNLEISAREISIFPILPSISWNITF